MCLTKVGVLTWYSSMKKKFGKIRTIFDIEKWLWKSEFCNFVSLSTLSEKVQKNFQCNFCDSATISFIVISFHQILLTWWNAYQQINSTKRYLLLPLSTKLYVCKQSAPTPQNSLIFPSNIHAQGRVHKESH